METPSHEKIGNIFEQIKKHELRLLTITRQINNDYSKYNYRKMVNRISLYKSIVEHIKVLNNLVLSELIFKNF